MCFENAGCYCELCGKCFIDCQLHPHHIVSRANRATRWWLPNLVCLCASHHTMSLKSAHKNPAWFLKEMEKIRGKKWLDELSDRANKQYKGDFEDVKNYLENKADSLYNNL